MNQTITHRPHLLPEGWSAPAGFDLVDIGVVHPANGQCGVLLRNARTGIYVLNVYGAFVSVPKEWALRVEADSPYRFSCLESFEASSRAADALTTRALRSSL